MNFLLPDKRGCKADRLSVFDGPNFQSPLMGVYCQLPDSIPLRFQSKAENLFVEFKSDSDFHGNFLFLVRAISAGNQSVPDETELSCLTSSGAEYRGTKSVTNGTSCDNWPVADVGFFPDRKLEPYWNTSFVREFTENGTNGNNYCRATDNDITISKQRLLPICKVDGTPTQCQIPDCKPRVTCAVDYSACSTGECIPKELLCDRIPQCSLREDEISCSIKYNFHSVAFDFSTHLMNSTSQSVSWQIPLNQATGASSSSSNKMILFFENEQIPSSLWNSLTGSSLYSSQHLKLLQLSAAGNLLNIKTYFTDTNNPLPTYLPLISGTNSIQFQLFDEIGENGSDRRMDKWWQTRSGIDTWTPPSEFSELAVTKFFSKLSYAHTDCIYEMSYNNGLVFTNNGPINNNTGFPSDYKSLQTCIYRVANINEPVTLNLNYKLERKVEFYESTHNTCYDFLKVIVDGVVYQFENEMTQLCGEGNYRIELEPNSTVEMLLVTDQEGKYSQLSNPAFYEVNPSRTVLSCCASDCESNLKCNCDDDTGNFEVELATRQQQFLDIKPRSSKLMSYARDSWTVWYSSSQPSGVKVAGLYLSGGEYELTEVINSTGTWTGTSGLCQEDKLIAVECKSLLTNKTDRHFDQKNVQCDQNGLVCLNRNQAGQR